MVSSQYDSIFLSYIQILERLKIYGIKTKHGKEITFMDLVKAVTVMDKKHSACRWKSEKVKSRKYYILVEGYYWLMYVYFCHEKKLIDRDIDFFVKRISQYEELLKVESKNLFCDDMYQQNLETYFNHKKRSVETAIKKMLEYNLEYRYSKNGKYVISKKGIEWLCKNCFKQKYLEILENYKMELTEKYIEAGFPYDNFFRKN